MPGSDAFYEGDRANPDEREPFACSRVSDNSDRQATKLRGRLSDVRVLRAA